MESYLRLVRQLSRFLDLIAGIAITFAMLLTVCDVILRAFRAPIVGTYELVAFTGAVVIGFALPMTSWIRGHIFVDFLVLRMPPIVQKIFNFVTRLIGIVLFYLIGWNLIKMASDLQESGEVSPTIQLPFYPIAFAIGICCFVQCLVLVADIVKIFGGKYE
jgi:TRAP-type C4-dicarboxylate transport system permease small subunit